MINPTGPQPAIRPCAMCGASSEFADTFCDVCDDCRATGEILTGTVRIGSWALSPEAAEKIAQEAVQAAVGVIRRRLVECQDEAKRQLLASGPDGGRYFAGRYDGFRDALAILAGVER